MPHVAFYPHFNHYHIITVALVYGCKQKKPLHCIFPPCMFSRSSVGLLYSYPLGFGTWNILETAHNTQHYFCYIIQINVKLSVGDLFVVKGLCFALSPQNPL